MKKNTFILLSAIILSGCASSCVTSTQKSDSVRVDSLAIYKAKIDSLNLEISDLYDQLDAAQDELQMREGEISYWGHKYDSCMTVLLKNKSKKK